MLDVSQNPGALSYLSFATNHVEYLIHLNLSACEIRNLSIYPLVYMRNLIVLDLSFNYLEIIESNAFIEQGRLTTLVLHDNLNILSIEPSAFVGLASMDSLTLTNLQIDRLQMSSFASLSLDRLELSHTVIQRIESNAFDQLSTDELYMNATEIISFSSDMFKGFVHVNLLVTDDFKFCCIRPYFLAEDKCFPHKDEFSSCSDLLRNAVLRSLIWIIGVFALTGNSLSLFYRMLFDRERLKLGYGMFVSNLAISDFLMGVYLIIIASADMFYRGEYNLYDKSWRHSTLCQFAGILASLSSEGSVMFIGLITIDRILVIKFPLGDFRITEIPAKILTSIAWVVSITISIIPVVFTSYFKDQFYSKSGVCLALPLTRQRPPGWMYSVCLFIGFNFITIILCIFGQWMIYYEIVSSKRTLAKSALSRANDLKIARNLLTVAATDFLCWFPIGILGKSLIISSTKCKRYHVNFHKGSLII